MAQQIVDSKAGELGLDPVNGELEAGLLSQDKEFPSLMKKTPLRDLQSDCNIVAQKGPNSSNPLVLKEVVITEAAKSVSGTKRPSSEAPMSTPSSSNGGNGHLVYVRRKSEVDAAKNSSNNEVVADNVNSPQLRQQVSSHQEDEHLTKSLINEVRMQCLPAFAPIPTTSLTSSLPSTKPSVPAFVGNSNDKAAYEEPQNLSLSSAVTSSSQSKINKNIWEERYLQLQLYLKTLDQSSLEDHILMLRSFSAVELSRHAVDLEKRAIQLSLEQAKELQRVKTLNVLGKSLRTSNEPVPSLEQQMPQN